MPNGQCDPVYKLKRVRFEAFSDHRIDVPLNEFKKEFLEMIVFVEIFV